MRILQVKQTPKALLPPTPISQAPPSFDGFTLAELEQIKDTFFPSKGAGGGRAGGEEGGAVAGGGDGCQEEGSECGGGISEGRFEAVMRSLGFGHLPLVHMHHLLDADGNGLVEQQELLSGLSALRSHGVDTLRFCFDIYDADGSGEISFDELAHVLEALLPAAAHCTNGGALGYGGDNEGVGGVFTPGGGTCSLTPRTAHATHAGVGHDMHFDTPFAPQLYGLFERLDTNHDGTISWEEFKAGVLAEPMLAAAFHAHKPTPAAHVERDEARNKRQRRS
jgi:Ca2+-binding EF-hand superfamily protein